MGFGGWVDRSADLWYPQGDAVVLEDGVHEAVLVAVERSVRFADHYRVEAAAGVAERGEQESGLGAAFPGDRSGLADVEVLGGDFAVGVGQGLGAGELPCSGGLGVLLVFGRYPSVERESHRQATFVSVSGCLSVGVCRVVRAASRLWSSRRSAAARSGVMAGGWSGRIIVMARRVWGVMVFHR